MDDLIAGLTLNFVRPSLAWDYNASGNIVELAVNEPRFGHDPDTLVSRGLGVNEASTNEFLNSEVPVTQDIATTAQSYTVSIRGSGSITLTGTATGVSTQNNDFTVTATA
ncbi:MAG: hypothetical protein IIB46_00560, partial [Nitrospinae bacterium]|nr:hypothetical protein [Nitrospinota bacterium]